MTTNTAPKAFTFQAVLKYTNLSGERCEKVFADASKTEAESRLQHAIAKCKAANPSHDMKEQIELVKPAAPEYKNMTRSQMRMERSEQAYFRRTAPNCGRALGYNC